MKFEHANHNFSVCTYLCKVTDYPDWIITTAFYSSVHHVDDIIFPIDENLNNKKFTFERIESYARFLYEGRHKTRLSLHETRLNLVEEKFNSIFPLFKGLFDASKCARYTNYKAYNFKDAQQFYKDAEEIKNFALDFNRK